MSLAVLRATGESCPVKTARAVRSDTRTDIRVARDLESFLALEQAWNDLFARSGRPDQIFQSFDWLWHWSRHCRTPKQRPVIVTGWEGGRLVMVWPLVAERQLGLVTLRWMGEPASQYGDVLVEEGPHRDDLLREGWRWVRRERADLAALRKVRATSPVRRILAEAGLCSARTDAPFLPFGDARSFAEVQNRFSAKARSSRRRLVRRLEETGAVTYVALDASQEARALVASGFAMKRTSLAEQGQSAPAFETPAMEAMFADAVSGTERPVGTLVNAVLRDGVPVAIGISFTCKGWGFGHILAFDGRCAKQGAGVILAERIFEAAHARGLVGFDMLGPADDFKRSWSPEAVAVEDWAVPLSLAGSLAVRLWYGGTRERLKRLLLAAPPWVAAPGWAFARLARGRRSPRA